MLDFRRLARSMLPLVVIAQLALTSMALTDNVSMTTEFGARQCHWCGPRAEQVHRERSPAECAAAADHTTLCDPGYPYCAIVATALPLTISKICTKTYQDECYPLYCGTTKTWKMTCTCKGDLCNDQITDREREAFEALNKLVAQNRIKRGSSHDNVTDIDNSDNGTTHATLPYSISDTEQARDNTVDYKAQKPRILSSDEIKPTIQVEPSTNINNADYLFTEDVVGYITNGTKIVLGMSSPKINTTTKLTDAPSITIVEHNELPPVESLQQNTTPTTHKPEDVPTTVIAVTQTETTTAQTTAITTKPQNNENDSTTAKIIREHEDGMTTKTPKVPKNHSDTIVLSLSTVLLCFIVKYI